jgi:hypothetical protein
MVVCKSNNSNFKLFLNIFLLICIYSHDNKMSNDYELKKLPVELPLCLLHVNIDVL